MEKSILSNTAKRLFINNSLINVIYDNLLQTDYFAALFSDKFSTSDEIHINLDFENILVGDSLIDFNKIILIANSLCLKGRCINMEVFNSNLTYEIAGILPQFIDYLNDPLLISNFVIWLQKLCDKVGSTYNKLFVDCYKKWNPDYHWDQGIYAIYYVVWEYVTKLAIRYDWVLDKIYCDHWINLFIMASGVDSNEVYKVWIYLLEKIYLNQSTCTYWNFYTRTKDLLSAKVLVVDLFDQNNIDSTNSQFLKFKKNDTYYRFAPYIHDDGDDLYVTKNKFLSNMNEYSGGILCESVINIINGLPNAVLSGSIIMKCISSKANLIHSNDIDLYITKSDFETFSIILNAIYKEFASASITKKSNCVYECTPNSTEDLVENPKIKLQIILVACDNPIDVVKSFDLGCIKVCYNLGKLLALNDFLVFNHFGIAAVVQNDHLMDNLKYRTLKYIFEKKCGLVVINSNKEDMDSILNGLEDLYRCFHFIKINNIGSKIINIHSQKQYNGLGWDNLYIEPNPSVNQMFRFIRDLASNRINRTISIKLDFRQNMESFFQNNSGAPDIIVNGLLEYINQNKMYKIRKSNKASHLVDISIDLDEPSPVPIKKILSIDLLLTFIKDQIVRTCRVFCDLYDDPRLRYENKIYFIDQNPHFPDTNNTTRRDVIRANVKQPVVSYLDLEKIDVNSFTLRALCSIDQHAFCYVPPNESDKYYYPTSIIKSNITISGLKYWIFFDLYSLIIKKVNNQSFFEKISKMYGTLYDNIPPHLLRNKKVDRDVFINYYDKDVVFQNIRQHKNKILIKCGSSKKLLSDTMVGDEILYKDLNAKIYFTLALKSSNHKVIPMPISIKGVVINLFGNVSYTNGYDKLKNKDELEQKLYKHDGYAEMIIDKREECEECDDDFDGHDVTDTKFNNEIMDTNINYNFVDNVDKDFEDNVDEYVEDFEDDVDEDFEENLDENNVDEEFED